MRFLKVSIFFLTSFLFVLQGSMLAQLNEDRWSLNLIHRTHYFSANTGNLDAVSGFAIGNNYELGVNCNLSNRLTATLELGFVNNSNLQFAGQEYAVDNQTGNLVSKPTLDAIPADASSFSRLHMRYNRAGLGVFFALLPQREEKNLGILLGYSLGFSLVAWYDDEIKVSPIMPGGVFVYEANDHRRGVVHRLNNNMLLLDSQVELAFQLPKNELFPFKLIHSIAVYADITHTNVLKESFTLMPFTTGIKTRFKIFTL